MYFAEQGKTDASLFLYVLLLMANQRNFNHSHIKLRNLVHNNIQNK